MTKIVQNVVVLEMLDHHHCNCSGSLITSLSTLVTGAAITHCLPASRVAYTQTDGVCGRYRGKRARLHIADSAAPSSRLQLHQVERTLMRTCTTNYPEMMHKHDSSCSSGGGGDGGSRPSDRAMADIEDAGNNVVTNDDVTDSAKPPPPLVTFSTSLGEYYNFVFFNK